MRRQHLIRTTLLIGAVATLLAAALPAAGQSASAGSGNLSLEEILQGVEKRYAGTGFSARFHQRSILKAMDLADAASGTILVKRPGKMRWAYEEPEKQLIITNGIDLWIYKPEDNQVTVGKAPSFFADGKGASFLSDMKQVREKFDIALETGAPEGHYMLKLTPHGSGIDIAVIYLTLSAQTFDIARIVTYNAYGDENLIDLKEIEYLDRIDDAQFQFEIPKGTDILQMDE